MIVKDRLLVCLERELRKARKIFQKLSATISNRSIPNSTHTHSLRTRLSRTDGVSKKNLSHSQ